MKSSVSDTNSTLINKKQNTKKNEWKTKCRMNFPQFFLFSISNETSPFRHCLSREDLKLKNIQWRPVKWKWNFRIKKKSRTKSQLKSSSHEKWKGRMGGKIRKIYTWKNFYNIFTLIPHRGGNENVSTRSIRWKSRVTREGWKFIKISLN